MSFVGFFKQLFFITYKLFLFSMLKTWIFCGYFKYFSLFFISSFCLSPCQTLHFSLLPIPPIIIILSLPYRSDFIHWTLKLPFLWHLFTLPFLEMTESYTNSCKPWLSGVLISCFLSCPSLQLEDISPSNTLDLFRNCWCLHRLQQF